MTDELKQEFTNRITHANRTELIVILYDMFDEYASEAERGYEDGGSGDEESLANIRYASEVLKRLRDDLDFSQGKDLCEHLYSIYTYCLEALAKATYNGKCDTIREARTLIKPLREAFSEISAQDVSQPMMSNVQERVAGYTYGKNDVNEADISPASNRGYLV